jgi:hypothetical protein
MTNVDQSRRIGEEAEVDELLGDIENVEIEDRAVHAVEILHCIEYSESAFCAGRLKGSLFPTPTSTGAIRTGHDCYFKCAPVLRSRGGIGSVITSGKSPANGYHNVAVPPSIIGLGA